jgi:hypothetical protein
MNDALRLFKLSMQKINDSSKIGLLIQQFYSYDFQKHWATILDRMGIWSGLFI